MQDSDVKSIIETNIFIFTLIIWVTSFVELT